MHSYVSDVQRTTYFFKKLLEFSAVPMFRLQFMNQKVILIFTCELRVWPCLNID